MKENYTTALTSSSGRVILVPYRRHHVLKYHKWMCDPEMLEATASEPLSIEEEYAMQKTWRDDVKKVTFIVEIGDSLYKEIETKERDGSKGARAVEAEVDEEEEMKRMVGDVNLFLHDRDDPTNAEIEVMIAEKNYLRRGLAYEALVMLMLYGVKDLGITRYFAKIHETNSASIALFQKLGYSQCNYVPAFQEYEYELKVVSATPATAPAPGLEIDNEMTQAGVNVDACTSDVERDGYVHEFTKRIQEKEHLTFTKSEYFALPFVTPEDRED